MISRLWLERAFRAASFGLLAWAAWLVARPAPASTETARARLSRAAAELPRWTRAGASLHASVAADSLGSDTTRAWLGAIGRAGATIGWHIDSALAHTALVVDPVPDPARPVAVAVAARGHARTILRDGDFDADTLLWPGRDAPPRGRMMPRPVATLTADGASALLRDSLVLRPVVVAGRASWEARFVIAALEEEGWRVLRRIVVAPGAVAQQDASPPLDTANYAAVILLDSTAAPLAPAAARFAARGGGVVVAGTAARIRALAPLLAARIGSRQRAPLFEAVKAPASAASGGYWPLAPLPGAVPLERVGSAVTVAARVVGGAGGRLVQVGYDESWRWRLEGADDAPLAHRRWWSRVVAGAARAPLVALAGLPATSPAPLAELHEALGAPSPERPDERRLGGRARPDLRVLFGAILLLLLAEWGSRRLRGER